MKRDEQRRYWEERIRECGLSGKSVRSYCEDTGLKEWQYYSWQRRLKDAPASRVDGFVPVGLVGGHLTIRLRRGAVLEVPSGFPSELLKTAIECSR